MISDKDRERIKQSLQQRKALTKRDHPMVRYGSGIDLMRLVKIVRDTIRRFM